MGGVGRAVELEGWCEVGGEGFINVEEVNE